MYVCVFVCVCVYSMCEVTASSMRLALSLYVCM